MKSIRILQLGDIHYPDAINAGASDWKDKGFPKATGKVLTPIPLQNVIRKIAMRLSSSAPPDAILISGDLTDKGVFSGYKQCLDYLDRNLSLSKRSADSVHTVPGNHDLDRKSLRPAKTRDALWKKFQKLKLEWERIGLPILPVETFRKTSIRKDAAVVNIHSINSCIGCGELRNFPESIRDRIHELLKGLSPDPSVEFELLGEQLDSPSFDEEAMVGLCAEIDSNNKMEVSLILTHHNLLPQAMPRFEIYTEAINSGLFRTRIYGLQSPILYCHGHIHDDPIEKICNPKQDHRDAIVVSAPLLANGFNEIEIQFSDSGEPLGCIVSEFRVGRSAVIESKPDRVVRMSFKRPADMSIQKTSITAHSLRALKLNGTSYYEDLYTTVCRRMKTSPRRKTFEEDLLVGEWFGIYKIINRDAPSGKWQIERIVP